MIRGTRGRTAGSGVSATILAMPTVRIGVASTPLTATLEEAVPAAIAAVEEAARPGRPDRLPARAALGPRAQPATGRDARRDGAVPAV